MNRDEFGAADVEPLEDLRRGAFAEEVRHRGVARERAEGGEHVPSAPEPILVGSSFGAYHRPVERPPVPALNLEREPA